MGFDIATGQVSSVTISGSKSKGKVDANSTSYNESTLKADKNLDFTSGKDTNIKGGKLSGEKVTGNAGKDLNIESKQDKNSYKEKNSSAGFGVGIDLSGKNKKDGIITTDKKDKASNANKAGIFGSAIKSNVDSNYNSVTDQSGIYAGKEGFDINVGENTDLKGGIISSEAAKDKNKISTGTLTYEDIQNKADYKAGSIGINVDTSKNAKKKDAGVTPNIGVGAKDDAESVTKATVSEGEIEIRDKGNQKQDLKDLNRDTKNSLNKLGEIFDKTKVEERQELAGLFGEIAYKAVGDLAIKHGWQEGSAEKNALHALVGGIMSELTNSGFLAGASGAMINEMIQDKLSDMFKDNPAMHQWASALIGGVVAQVAADNAQMGAATASSGTKNNYLTHEQQKNYETEIEAIEKDDTLTDKQKEIAKKSVDLKYDLISALQDREWLNKNLNRYQSITENDGRMTFTGFYETVGVDKNNKAYSLTTNQTVVHSKEFETLLNSISPGDRIKFADGDTYYVQPNGQLYKENSLGFLTTYKQISFDGKVENKRYMGLFDNDTNISKDTKTAAGQLAVGVVDGFVGIKTGWTYLKYASQFGVESHAIAGSVLIISGVNSVMTVTTTGMNELISDSIKPINFVKDIWLDKVKNKDAIYDNFDKSAKGISIMGDMNNIVSATKKGVFDKINWDKVAVDKNEYSKVQSVLHQYELYLDIKSLYELTEDYQNEKNNK